MDKKILNLPNKEFYDFHWNKWSDMKTYGPMSRHIRRLCLNFLNKVNCKSILDVGCGEGHFLKEIHLNRPYMEIAGMDISAVAINNARINLPNAKFYILDLEKKYIEEKFDLITAIDVIEHIDDDAKFLENIYRMTEKYFLVCTLTGKMRPSENNVGHLRNYSYSELISKLEAAGFAAISVKKWGFPFYSPIYRNLLQFMPQGATIGKFNFIKKMISALLYALFFINFYNRGDIIIILSEAK